MMKFLLPMSIIYLILTIIGVIWLVREVKKSDSKEDMTLIIISFLVPLIGLIIYAVNVGKDKHITDCALKGLKMVLKLIIVEIIISAIAIIIFYSKYNKEVDYSVSTKKIPVSKVDINSKELITKDMIDYIEMNSTDFYLEQQLQGAIKDTKDIIGKYVYACSVSKGSMFYDDCLVDTLP